MAKKKTPRDIFIQDLENTFKAAMEAGNFGAALKAKELLARELGFLEKRSGNGLLLKPLKDMTVQELKSLIQSCVDEIQE